MQLRYVVKSVKVKRKIKCGVIVKKNLHTADKPQGYIRRPLLTLTVRMERIEVID